MKSFKKFALVASIALAATGAAHATSYSELGGSDTPIEQLNTYGGDNQWTFSDASYDTDLLTGDAFSRTKGTTFVDYFILNVPDDEYITLSFGNVRGAVPGIEFTELDIGYAYNTGPEVYDETFASKTYAVTTDSLTLTSGTYEIDIYGTFTQANGSFEGDVFGSPVPEPANAALLLAGLGAVGALGRRRKMRA